LDYEQCILQSISTIIMMGATYLYRMAGVCILTPARAAPEVDVGFGPKPTRLTASFQ
jgi:hypothetical protein